jgi:hypothetical protein
MINPPYSPGKEKNKLGKNYGRLGVLGLKTAQKKTKDNAKKIKGKREEVKGFLPQGAEKDSSEWGVRSSERELKAGKTFAVECSFRPALPGSKRGSLPYGSRIVRRKNKRRENSSEFGVLEKELKVKKLKQLGVRRES